MSFCGCIIFGLQRISSLSVESKDFWGVFDNHDVMPAGFSLTAYLYIK